MKQPDIEIYVKNTSAGMIKSWLESAFKQIDLPDLNDEQLDLGLMLKGKVDELSLVITPKAAGKAYASIWFQSDNTPWEDDLACAKSFFEHTGNEVRCSASTWTEEEAEDEEKWWVLDDAGQKLVRWG